MPTPAPSYLDALRETTATLKPMVGDFHRAIAELARIDKSVDVSMIAISEALLAENTSLVNAEVTTLQSLMDEQDRALAKVRTLREPYEDARAMQWRTLA